LHPCKARFRFVWQNHCKLSSQGLTMPLPGGAVAFSGALLPACDRAPPVSPSRGQPAIHARDITDGAMQAHIVVAIDVLLNQPFGVLLRQRCARPDAFALQRSMPALPFSVRLRVERRGSDVRHAGGPDELLEVPCHELRSIVGDDRFLTLTACR